MKVIHFTENENFDLKNLKNSKEIIGISSEYDGLFVYKYSLDFPDEIWSGRNKVIFNIDDQHVELIQENPMNDSRLDEYLIRSKNFKSIKR